MAAMTDVASRQGLKRKAPTSDLVPSSQVSSLHASSSQAIYFLLQIPPNINTNLPVWDAIRAQQMAVVCTVTPYIVNVSITPMGPTQGKTSAPNPIGSSSLLQKIIPQSMSQSQSDSAPGVRILVSQNIPLPMPSSSGQSVPDSCLIVPLPLLITQGPAASALPTKKPAPAASPPLTMMRLRPLSDRSLFHIKPADDVLICDSFLTGSCRKGRRCRMHHTPFPFHWQLLSKSKEKWVDINPGSQVMLERIYCNINRSTIWLMNGANRHTLFFDEMELEYNTEYNDIRRLSNSHFPSEWKIYWRASANWEEYDQVTSNLLLQKMKLNEPKCHFLIGSEKYILDFKLMNQIDVKTGFTKKVRWRPVYRSPEFLPPGLRAGFPSEPIPTTTEPPDPIFSVDPLEEFSSWYPPVWRLPMEHDYSLVDVPEGTQAFRKIKKLFHESMSESSVDIISIQQVQNVLHWDKYQRQKASMQKLHSNSKQPLERHLFHGTTKNAAELICQNNFDPRLAGVNGAMYGLGSYFATTASQSSNFTGKVVANKIGYIFLAKALVGNVSLGKKSYRRPPPLCAKTKQHRLHDTCVDSLEDPTMFVVFNSCQCFPYYLIKYKDLPEEIEIMAEMTDVASRQWLKRKAPASGSVTSLQAPSSQVSSSQALSFLVEVPANINTNLPVWDAIRSQQMAVAWTVNPYVVNVSITPMGSTHGKTPALNPTGSCCLVRQIILQSTPVPQSDAAPGVCIHVSQNAALPMPSSSGQLVLEGGFIVLLPLLITQQPAATAPPTLAAPPPLTMSRLRPLCDRSLFHTKPADDVLICDSFLAGTCHMGRRCRMHHTPFPFHWQLLSKHKEEWVDINPGSQVLLERIYCNIKRSSICLKNGANSYTLCFDQMELEKNTEYNDIRRLSNLHFPSEWKIYSKTSTNWEEFDQVTSNLLLQKMKLNEPKFHFLIGSEKYILDFNMMNQIAVNMNFTKKVRCRPVYRSPEPLRPDLRAGYPSEPIPTTAEPPDPHFSVDPLEEFSSWYPPVWRLPMEHDYSLVDVPEGTQAFRKVKKLFHESMSESSVDIISIQQVQNVLHWDKYQRQKASMQKLHSNSKQPLERHLFHGTTKNAAELICQNNFDPRLAGVNGAMYGLGSYFATTASQSSNFTGKVVTNKIGHIFLAKVLVGNVSLGKKSYRRPPPLCAKTMQDRLHDTCVDSLEDSTMFVVFDSCQCFPYYLIKYKDLPDEIYM